MSAVHKVKNVSLQVLCNSTSGSRCCSESSVVVAVVNEVEVVVVVVVVVVAMHAMN